MSTIADSAETDDYFGAFLAAGNIDDDATSGNNECDDLAIGVPGEGLPDSVNTNRAGAGAVAVLYGSTSGLDNSSDELWHQGVSGIPDDNETGDHFGQGISVVDKDEDGYWDLVVSAPGDEAFFVILGTSSGLDAAGSLSQGSLSNGGWNTLCRWACEGAWLLLPPGPVCDCSFCDGIVVTDPCPNCA